MANDDESWVYSYDPETKIQSSQWKTSNSPCPKKARQSNVKVKLTVFFDCEDIVRLKVHSKRNNLLQRLRKDVRREQQKMGQWLFSL